MNVEELVRDSLRELAAEQPSAGPGYADRVLAVRRRRRTRRLASVAAATAAVVGIAVAVPLLDGGKKEVRPASVLNGRGTSAHPDQSPPRDLIAAGDVALAAYYTTQIVPQRKDRGVSERTYWLLDQRTGRYEKDTRWSFVAVAPGMRTAAVLERNLPAQRIGLLDLATGEVERWIPVDHGVGGLAFSYDGRKLVATTYDENPDLRIRQTGDEDAVPWVPQFQRPSRSGFHVVDIASGTASWTGVRSGRGTSPRQDFFLSRAGDLVYTPVPGPADGSQQFYDLDGNKVAAPADERYLRTDVGARLSPDGSLAAGGLSKEVPDKSYSSIRDPRTGREITKVRGAELLAWVDEKRLIAQERTAGEGLYRPRLVLVTIGSDEVEWLSGPSAQKDDDLSYAWEPVLARR
ncbi:WD40 repeat domain-containing protein [Streptomyces sp. NPDC006385]|uniref:WD40 repeat domain-containing protein n=1 Tax=Streptomyces sp. NPDC006385 TaxID=3156761 RepID=UPI0033A97C62